MRTRRSPRNQEILFRALFKTPDAPKVERDPLAPIEPWPFMSPRAKRELERENMRLAHKRAIRAARPSRRSMDEPAAGLG